ncbi:2-hydroxyacyl-CoA dehydratase [Candidatus Dojkabacteria bacterium]|nr:2-hydroxyacyl-CoA dehydratase [Candidatus Dojkabacteria bacterium]
MSKLKKKIAITPLFWLEAGISAFIDKNEYEIIPIEISQRILNNDYAQTIFGDWCAPLKFVVAGYERAIIKDKVTKIIGLNYNFCSFPFVLGNINEWIEQDFEYFPISINKLYMTPSTFASLYEQLRKALPELSMAKFVRLLPEAMKRADHSNILERLYAKTIPLVENPQSYSNIYKIKKGQLINAVNIQESQSVIDSFQKISADMKKSEEPEYRILISGDAESIFIGFPLFDLDTFFAQHHIEIVHSSFGYQTNRDTTIGQKTTEIMTERFSNKNSKTFANDQHVLELSTLYHVLEGINKDIDGIVFVKPNMCSPCDNVSFVLKKHNYFEKPFVELSYDEHSGVNGILTRLEAFLNILKETTPSNIAK